MATGNGVTQADRHDGAGLLVRLALQPKALPVLDACLKGKGGGHEDRERRCRLQGVRLELAAQLAEVDSAERRIVGPRLQARC